MTTSVYCVASSESKANDILASLKTSGLVETEVSVLRPEKVGTQFPARDKPGRPADEANAAAGTRLVAALGVSEQDANRFQGKLRDGNTLIAAHPGNADHLKTAKDIFEKAGATDIGQGDKPSAQAAPPSGVAATAKSDVADVPLVPTTSQQSTAPTALPTTPQRAPSRS